MFLRKNINSLTIDDKRKNKKINLQLLSFDSKRFNNKKNRANKEFLKLISTNINKDSKNNDDNPLFSKTTSCILGIKCPYYKKYLNLKEELIRLLSSMIKVKHFNHSLFHSLSKRTNLYFNLISENEELKKVLHQKRFFESSNKQPQYNYNYNNSNELFKKSDRSSKSSSFKNIKNKNHSLTENNYINKILNISKVKKEKQSHFLKNILLNENIENYIKINDNNSFNNLFSNKKDGGENNTYNNYLKKNATNTNIRHNILSINSDPNKHYEILHNYSKQKNKIFNTDSSKFSFLSTNMDYSNIIKHNQTLINLEQLTKSDEHFLKEMADSSNEGLLKYCDMIIALINDYKEMIKLGIRMKEFIKGSNRFVDSIIDNNTSKVIIENTCSILNCDRVSLFILDKLSDSLIVYSGEGIKKAQIKVPKDKGIVGTCFLEGKKIRIEDAYLDKRFNKDVDKKTNYRTKSILCYPLIDKDGECYGVIEAINKFISPFNDDDEELLRLLSNQANIIFRSLPFNDDYKFLTSKLNIVIDYNIEISYIKNKVEFAEKTEDTLLNLFNCIYSAFYFVEDNMLKRYKENIIEKFDMNIGIIGKVIKSKEILTFQNIKNCAEFNSIIDMNTSDGLLTFPILGKKNKIVRAVVQVPYLGKVFQNGKPNENEIKIIKKFRKCIKNWIQINL